MYSAARSALHCIQNRERQYHYTPCGAFLTPLYIMPGWVVPGSHGSQNVHLRSQNVHLRSQNVHLRYSRIGAPSLASQPFPTAVWHTYRRSGGAFSVPSTINLVAFPCLNSVKTGCLFREFFTTCECVHLCVYSSYSSILHVVMNSQSRRTRLPPARACVCALFRKPPGVRHGRPRQPHLHEEQPPVPRRRR